MDRALMQLSGLQHFAFCKRQWALIYIEQQWSDNVHTAQGDVFHSRAHDEAQTEVRGDKIIMRGLRVQSEKLGATGICDVVEFIRDDGGIALSGYDGRYGVYPVEYKKGAPKQCDTASVDELQLCAQAMCLEEMLACEIAEGSLFYGETRRRMRVPLTHALRQCVAAMLDEMRQHYMRGYTPRVKPHKGCTACSLKELCVPRLQKASSVEAYIRQHIKENTP